MIAAKLFYSRNVSNGRVSARYFAPYLCPEREFQLVLSYAVVISRRGALSDIKITRQRRSRSVDDRQHG
ncbi:unnamed protein product [Calypogeia fissa]